MDMRGENTLRMNVVVLAIALTTTVELSHTQAPRPTSLPARFERFLAGAVKPTAAERKLLLDGAPLTKLLDGDPSKEIAVFGAVWIDAPRERYAAAVKDIERFESGGAFRITRKISVPPTLADFAELRLPEEDVADLGDCEVGDCELKLGKASIDAIRSRVNFSQPGARSAVEAVFRERAHEYVTAYREKGNAGLAVYRDASRPTFVANELRSMIDRMPTAMGLLPELRTYLLEYPNATLPNSTDFLYWQEAQFGLKPTIRINHLVIHENANETVVASKMLYASHYFWTALEVRVLATGSRARSGFLVHYCQSLSIGWLERFHWTNPSGPRQKRSAAGDRRCIEADESQDGRLTVNGWIPALGGIGPSGRGYQSRLSQRRVDHSHKKTGPHLRAEKPMRAHVMHAGGRAS